MLVALSKIFHKNSGRSKTTQVSNAGNRDENLDSDGNHPNIRVLLLDDTEFDFYVKVSNNIGIYYDRIK